MPMVRMHWLTISLMNHYEATISVVMLLRRRAGLTPRFLPR